MTKAELQERFEFRDVRAEEADQTIAIENICFPPNEACSSKSMTERASQAQETFLVAVDKETGKIAGFLNGIATDEEVFRDEFFTDIRLHNIKGKNIMILGLDVLPEYRGQGLSRERRLHDSEHARGGIRRETLRDKAGDHPQGARELPADSRKNGESQD